MFQCFYRRSVLRFTSNLNKKRPGPFGHHGRKSLVTSCLIVKCSIGPCLFNTNTHFSAAYQFAVFQGRIKHQIGHKGNDHTIQCGREHHEYTQRFQQGNSAATDSGDNSHAVNAPDRCPVFLLSLAKGPVVADHNAHNRRHHCAQNTDIWPEPRRWPYPHPQGSSAVPQE